jgi:hypothetical protein
MKLLFLLLTFSSIPAFAQTVDTTSDLSEKDDELRQNYEGNIRGIRALMQDLQKNQPQIHRKLESDFTALDTKQSRADTIAYITYGTSAAFAAYGIASWFGLFKSKEDGSSGASFTPFLISLGTSFVGGWAYYFTRPSPQEYLDFTNRHNRLNKKQQLQWNLSLAPEGAAIGLAYQF